MTTVESQGLSARTHLLLNGACTASKPFSIAARKVPELLLHRPVTGSGCIKVWA